MFGRPVSERRPELRDTGGIRRETRRVVDTSNTIAGSVHCTTASIHWLTAGLAALASLIFVLTDANGNRSTGSLWIQITLELAGVLAATWFIRRQIAVLNDAPIIVPLLLIVAMASLLWEPVQRWLFDAGRPFETMVMHCLKNLMLAAAVLGCRAGYQRLSLVIGVSLAIFCVAIAREHRIQWLIAFYGFAAVSWMIGSYWDTLRSRLITGDSRRFPLRWLIVGPSIPLLLLLASATGSENVIVAMRGFLPGSGGNGDSDRFSRSGVNDGDSLVAGTDNIKSFGPIDDAPFAEDNKPSLYDVFNDQFDEPVRKTAKQDRSIALPPSLLAEINARMAKSGLASREFSTRRNTTPPDSKRIKDLNSSALFYVAGRVPVHFRMQIYDIFDGEKWYPEEPVDAPSGMKIVPFEGRPWLRVPGPGLESGLHTYTDTHAVKVINIKSPVIPAPPDLRGIHIDKVDQADMFAWHCDSIVKIDRASLPEYTAIQLTSERIDRSLLTNHQNLVFQTFSEAARTQLPQISQMEEVRTLAEQWTRDIPRGYRQIDAVVQKLRADYVIDRTFREAEDCECPAVRFLLESRRGPEYQFATAATLLLRSLGYSTRLVSGFYAREEKHDPRKRHTAVHAEDAHFWCEVFVGAGTWVTLEPSPGYQILDPPPSLFTRLLTSCHDAALWTIHHLLLVLSVTAGVLTALIRRLDLADLFNTIKWALFPAPTARGRVLQTAQLIDGRMRFLGFSRPCGTTLPRWLRQQSHLSGVSSALPDFLEMTNKAAFCRDESLWSVQQRSVEECCCAVRTQLTLVRCRRNVKQRTTHVTSSKAVQ